MRRPAGLEPRLFITPSIGGISCQHEIQPIDRTSGSGMPAQPGTMKRILFVDDDPSLLEALRRMLRPQRARWETMFAGGGEDALRMLELSPFDVVVTDMRMPGMDGAQLLERVRDRFPGVVRIVLSGYCEMASTLRAVPVAHQFLQKPCDAGSLVQAIERACGLSSALQDEAIRRIVGAVGEWPRPGGRWTGR